MEKTRAFRILTERMGYSGPDAEKMLSGLREYLLKEEQEKTIQNFPESWLLHLLNITGQLSDQERQYWVRHDLSLDETPQELDAMLTQAFCDPESFRVIRSLHE